MSASLSISEKDVFTALRAVLGTMGLVSSTSGQTVPIIRGDVNRVPEPAETDFVVMWPLMRSRLSYNVETWDDAVITASITANVMTVSAVAQGTVEVGAPVYVLNTVGAICTVTGRLTGAGGVGTYAVTPGATRASGTLYCGTLKAMQPIEFLIQLDVHGPPAQNAGDNAQRITTLMQGQFGVQAFLDTGYAVAPLYCTTPRMIPFNNAEEQIEERWAIEVALQVNPIVTVTGQFADTLEIDTVSVEAAYPV